MSWDQQHVVGNWGQDDGIGKMTAVAGSPNLWQITLGPTLRQYFSETSGTPFTHWQWFSETVMRGD